VSLSLRLQPYRLPLRRPWRSARGSVTERRGWLVTASDGDHAGYGDCAPLPDAGTEPTSVARQRLEFWGRRSSEDDAAELLDALAAIPSAIPAADNAVETALLDLCARRRGICLRQRLTELPSAPDPGGRSLTPATDEVAVNAMLGAAATVTDGAILAACAAGFRIIKLKIGLADWTLELSRLDQILTRLPRGAALRLDANGAWAPAQARSAIAALSDLDAGDGRIESLEEPLGGHNDGLLAALQDKAPFSLALDESLPRRAPVEPSRIPVRRLVLKPAAFGGLRATMDLARRAVAAEREVVLTSLVESAAGLWATAQLAGALASPLAQGLATADWLAADLGDPPPIVVGRILLPGVAGSGFSPSGSGSR
jgi:o-succinylbenzoate synthase